MAALKYIGKNDEGKQLDDFNKDLCVCLDNLGYCKSMIQYRRDKSKHMDNLHNGRNYPYYLLRTGSKAEGTALYYESDIDRLYEVKGVICLESESVSPYFTLFLLDMKSSISGYTRLQLMSNPDANNLIKKYLVCENGNFYISNDFTIIDHSRQMIDISGMTISKQNRRGPSSPSGNDFIKYDFVCGFKCVCSTLIQKWMERPRLHGWPEADLIKRISALDGHVVPVADKGSLYPGTEWRICYTKAELLLMESFNEFQTKLYILLKLLAKSVLKPICSEMSSYIMKNVVFWLIETNPKENFTGPFLVERVVDALVFLKESLDTNNLSSYLIAGRNLLQGRVTEEERRRLLKVLQSLITEKECMFRRCDKIHSGLLKLRRSPEEFLRESAQRKEAERLLLMKNVIFKEIEMPNHKVDDLLPLLQNSDKYNQLDEELHRLILPDREEVVSLGQDPESVYRQRIANILS